MSLDVIAFFAHPDDETMLAGGTLALLASQGARIHYLIATRGEGGEVGEPPLCTREALGTVRENELRCATQALGAASLTLMEYIDPTVVPDNTLYPFAEDVEQVAAQVVEAIRFWKAGAIITHGINGEYGHPAHKLVYQAARLAIHALGEISAADPNTSVDSAGPGEENTPLFYTVAAIFPGHPRPRLANADTMADMVIDINPVLAQKTAAAMCHQTQHALFIRSTSEEMGHAVSVPEVIMPVESLHRVWPPEKEPGQIHDALADILWTSGCARLPVTG